MFQLNPDFAVDFFSTNCQNAALVFGYCLLKIKLVYQSLKFQKANCFAVEILFKEDKMALFFSIAKSGLNFDKANNADVRRILINYTHIDQVQFLANAVSTKNLGVDIVLNSNWKIKKVILRFTLPANFNQTNLFGSIQTADSLSPHITKHKHVI